MMKEIIVIGADHHNTLGVLRSLGEKGINSILLLISENNKSYVAKSKYAKEVHFLTSEEEIPTYLLSHFTNNDCPVIIACYDAVASVLDENRNLLHEAFILPGVREQGFLTKIMDKEIMLDFAVKAGLNVPYSVTVESTSGGRVLPYPCIVKPLISKFGSKRDIKRCYNEEDWNNYQKEEHCTKVQVQQLIQKDYEFQLIGCSLDSGNFVIIPGYSQIIRSSGVTNTGYLKYIPSKDLLVDRSSCERFLRSIGYTGLFSMEFLHGKDGNNYFMEINFRNDGNAICVTASGVNLPFIYVQWHNGSITENSVKNINIDSMRTVYVMPEFDDMILLLKGEINIFRWIKDIIRTDCFMEFSKKDPIPFLYALIMFVIRGFKFLGKKII